MKKLSHSQYLEKVIAKWGNEYSILEEYKGQKTKLLVMHNSCRRKYYTYPDNLIRGHGCAKCFKENKLNRDKRISIEDITNYIQVNKNNEFELLEYYYKKGKCRIKVKHLVCEYESNMTYQNFKNSCGCSYCAEKQRRTTQTKTSQQFETEFHNMHGEEYSILEKYVGTKVKIKINHTTCGNDFYVTPSYALRRRASLLCPVCGKNERDQEKSISNKEFQEKLYNIYNDEYTTLSEYKRSQEKIKVRHNACGFEYEVVPSSILHGNGCPQCCNFDSKACKKIEQFLIMHNFDYVREFKIKDCKNKKALPFDFAIFDKNKIKILIEYDGEQHFKQVKYFGGEEAFKIRVQRDIIKNEYCKNNNIKLLRINYTQDDLIENILQKELL